MAVWPRRSWSRSAVYVTKRILRLTASPHAIAAGVAAGVFASFTPLLGFHFLIAFFLSYLIAGNFLAAAMGTFFGNPFTFPLIWGSTFTVGKFILTGAAGPIFHEDAPHARLGEITGDGVLDINVTDLLQRMANLWDPVVKPMLVGAVPLGVIAGIIAYMITRWVAVGFRAARRKRLAAKAMAQQRRLAHNSVAGAGGGAALSDSAVGLARSGHDGVRNSP